MHGGQQPITGSTIQLYAVGGGGDGTASTPLLTQTVVTDTNGGFNITNDYTCPTASTLVYIAASGGNPGMAAGTNNAAITAMAALGACNTLSASTFIDINEITTVAAVSSLSPFMTGPASIASGPSDASLLSAGFTTANQLANDNTGSAPGANLPPGITTPSPKSTNSPTPSLPVPTRREESQGTLRAAASSSAPLP